MLDPRERSTGRKGPRKAKQRLKEKRTTGTMRTGRRSGRRRSRDPAARSRRRCELVCRKRREQRKAVVRKEPEHDGGPCCRRHQFGGRGLGFGRGSNVPPRPLPAPIFLSWRPSGAAKAEQHDAREAKRGILGGQGVGSPLVNEKTPGEAPKAGFWVVSTPSREHTPPKHTWPQLRKTH